MEDLLPIINRFAVTGNITAVSQLGSGHIHETFYLKTGSDNTDDYVLQRINTHVFRNPGAVMHNIRIVTDHIRNKLEISGETDVKRRVLQPVVTVNGELMVNDATGSVWRCFVFIPDHKTFDCAVNVAQVYEGGKAYGQFLQLLSDVPADTIRETIPGFHDLDLRLRQFEESVKNGSKERLEETRDEIELLMFRKDEMRTILELGKRGMIPVRVVHHDTKINNVLFDSGNKALCVIDLDTVMPGHVHDDFGDSIRTFTNTGEEDDADLTKVSMNIHFFEAYAGGFLETAGAMLNKAEKEHLALSARVMTYMQTLRFLADYLNGDTYYRIHHPKHNLQRAMAQLKLLLSMEEQYGEMVRIVAGIR